MNLTLIDNYVVESFFFQGPSCSVFEYFALNQPKRKGFNCSFDVKHVSVAQFLPKLQVKMSKTDITLVSNSSNHPLCKNFRFWGWGGEDDDLFQRVKTKTLNITLISPNLGRFKVITTN